MILQLDPFIPVITPKGPGEAVGWIDYTKDDNLLWIVFLAENGESWIFQNKEIRAHPNPSLGRMPNRRTADVVKDLNEQK